ncbi:MAG: ATP-dependent RecD-like DNA helicase [Desulfohalobiaceae bacterium]
MSRFATLPGSTESKQKQDAPAELTGEVLSVVFYKPETNYHVLRLRADSEPGQVTVVGSLGRVTPGEELDLTGVWKDHPKFGRQFQALTAVQRMPASLNGIRRYLSSGMIKGVGPVMADRLIRAFDREVLTVLDESPEKLLQVEGLGPKKLAKITASWQAQREIRSLMLFLQTHEVPATFAGRIFQRYGVQAVHKLEQNPYDLAYEIRGIGFRTADSMALKLGFAPDCRERLEAALVYALFQAADQGHLFYPREALYEKVAHLVEIEDPSRLQEALESLQERKRVAVEPLPEQDIEAAVYLRHFHRFESETASRLQALAGHPVALPDTRLDALLRRLEKQSRLRLTGEQRAAVVGACQGKVHVITGGPGTGKTTITRTIAHGLKEMGLKVKLAAPTGRAAKRLAEATGLHASTLHRLLGSSPDGTFAYREEKKLKADALLVDEASMLDCLLFVHLLRALPLTCRLILVGDVHQLPSVGAGNVLADVIASESVACTVLTQIFRQARESTIIVNAHRINQGQLPVGSPREPPGADFFWVEHDDLEQVQSMILKLVCERIPSVYGYSALQDVQVLTPMHRGEVGTVRLNELLQERLNPGGEVLKRGQREFRVGDRVLQVQNNYEKDVFNGDLGWITSIDQEEGEVLVDFEGRHLLYDLSEMDELTLAYAISVHKSQGSEYPVVVMPVVTQHYMLLQRNLIYTGLTRARKLAVLVGSRRALSIGIKNVGGTRRYTHLRYRLKDFFANDTREPA